MHSCWENARVLDLSKEISFYLCPLRIISFDGFVNYEGRRFGVPYWYTRKTCRIQRKDYELTIYDDEGSLDLFYNPHEKNMYLRVAAEVESIGYTTVFLYFRK